jgi:hypothetical protein
MFIESVSPVQVPNFVELRTYLPYRYPYYIGDIIKHPNAAEYAREFGEKLDADA